MEMMDQMKKACDYIAGTSCGVRGATLKEPESKEAEKSEPSKTEMHKH